MEDFNNGEQVEFLKSYHYKRNPKEKLIFFLDTFISTYTYILCQEIIETGTWELNFKLAFLICFPSEGI